MSAKFIPRENPELYEINTGAWLYELSLLLGKPVRLRDVPSTEWDRLKALGMDLVWLMGVWNRSRLGRQVSLNDASFHHLFDTVCPDWGSQDVVGSCYSLNSHEPDPSIGTWEDIDHVRTALNQRNMGLILDFIPNHTGIDHNWLIEHPDYYIQVAEDQYQKDKPAFFTVDHNGQTLFIAHGRDPNFPPWTDTAQLNYFNPATREAMIQVIEKIALHCDGIRCDMAMLAINPIFQRIWGWANKNPAYVMPSQEFWAQATQRVPGLVFIAEAYWDTEWTLQQLGFDFVYDKRLYERLRNAAPREVYLHLKADLTYQRKLVRFIENHDELRSLTAFGPGKVKAAATLFSALPGMKLYFQGQLEGKQIRQPLQIRRTRPEPVNPEIRDFYAKLLPAVNQEIFHRGSWHLLEVFPESDPTAENLVAYSWKLGDSARLIVTNLSGNPSQGRISFPDEFAKFPNYEMTDILSGQKSVQSAQMMHSGIILKLQAYQGQLWEIASV